MSWKDHYLPPDTSLWQGRTDAPEKSCFFQVIQLLDLTKDLTLTNTLSPFAIIGFRCDEGVRRNKGRTGAAEGPQVIRAALAKLPVQKQTFQCYDAGDIVCRDGDLEAAQAALGEVIALLLKQGIKPIALGGGHEIAWGHYQGLAKAYPHKNIGIINFDAHFDMRPLLADDKGSSGTPFLQIAEAHRTNHRRFDYNCVGIQHAGNTRQLFETAKHYNTHILLADELHESQQMRSVDFIDRVIDQNDIIYATLCLDVFAAEAAPGVSAPQPLGVLPWHVIPLLRQLAASGKVISFDIAEMSPPYDIDYRTAKLAATMIYEFIHHHGTQPRPW